MNKLKLANRLYNSLIHNFLIRTSHLDDEILALEIQKIAHFLCLNYSGVLSDYRLENKLLEIGEGIETTNRKRETKNKKRKILHIATQLYNTGGHARVLRNWIIIDKHSDSKILFTNQTSDIPQWLPDIEIVKLDIEKGLIERASELRQYIINEYFDLIILHIHPYDVIPIISLSAENLPPVIFFNHADHEFSIGPSISDLFIDFRDVGRNYSIYNRLANESACLPYPLEPTKNITKEKARKQLDVDTHSLVLVSMATPYKYKPFKKYNFFNDWNDILRKNKSWKLFVIGVDENNYKKYCSKQKTDNIYLLGRIEQPYLYCAAADYFIEPYPLGTGLGTFDVVRYGALPIFNFFDTSIYGDGASSLFPEYLSNSIVKTRKKKYIKFIKNEFCENKIKLQRTEKFLSFISECEDGKWLQKLEDIYAKVLKVKHKTYINDKIKFLNNKASKNYFDFTSNSLWLYYKKIKKFEYWKPGLVVRFIIFALYCINFIRKPSSLIIYLRNYRDKLYIKSR